MKIVPKIKEFIINNFSYLFVLYNLFIKHKIFIRRPYYSDSGEDKYIMNQFKKRRGFYVDVGCHHPTRLNNCHLLYLNKWRGINIDINKISIELFKLVRKNDVNLHSAVSLKEKYVSFFYDKPLSLYNSLVKSKDLKFHKLVKSQKFSPPPPPTWSPARRALPAAPCPASRSPSSARRTAPRPLPSRPP